MRVPKDTLVVVADGGGARVLRNVGAAFSPELVAEHVLTPQNLNDDGPSGSVPTETRGEELDEATFAKQLAQWLNARALKQEFANLVLMADPQTLGQVRRSLHKEVNDRLVAEIDKNLSNATIEDIVKALSL